MLYKFYLLRKDSLIGQGIQKMKEIALSKIIFRIIGFIIIFFFVNSPSNAWIVLASFSLSNLLIWFYLHLLIVKEFGFLELKLSNASLELLNKSIFSFCITVLPVFYQNISLFALSIFVNPVQLGYLFGANRIYRAFNNLFGPVSQAFMPIISSVQEKNKNESKLLIKKYLLLMVIFGLSLFFLNFFCAEIIVTILLGSKYHSSIELLKIFSIILPLTAISNAIGRQWLIANNKDFYYFFSQSLSLLVAFIIFLLLVSNQGPKALPISLIFYELTSIIMILIFLYLK